MKSISNTIKHDFKIRILDTKSDLLPSIIESEEQAVNWQEERDRDEDGGSNVTLHENEYDRY
jgi:hypothetical protein